MNSFTTDSIYSPIPAGNGGVIVHRCLEQGIDNYHLRIFSPKLTLFPPLLRGIKRREAGIVHSSIELIAYLSHADQRQIATVHNYYLDDEYIERSDYCRKIYYSNFLRRQFLRGLHDSDRIVFVSNTTYDLVMKDLSPPDKIKKKCVQIINGVDCSQFIPFPHKKDQATFNILFAGNPSARKGWQLVLDLAKNLPKHCQILCTSGMRDVKKLPHLSNIRYIKSVPHKQMPSVYGEADVLLLPSYREGLSLVVLEAMACGLPVVGFRTSSMPEAIDSGKGGILVPLNDRKLLLAAIVELSNQADKCREFGLYNRERSVRRFNQDRMIAEYQAVFLE